uniref:Hydroxypyruvate isomerase (putative) n=1 Tax=Chelonoidis abingdonii TaxID=106734 RepID=A0A8C0J4T1_CHEAB
MWGLGAVPGRQAAFREGLALAVKYAKTLGCPRIHLMAGRVPVGTERAAMALEMEATFIENLRYAADILAQEDMTGLLEPMNSRITDPRYFLTTPHQGKGTLPHSDYPELQLWFLQDIFHCQIMDGNLTRNLEMYFPLIGHIQVGQVPGRHEPNSPGEVNFPYLFQLLESLGYEGYVGCEYTPQGERGWSTGTQLSAHLPKTSHQPFWVWLQPFKGNRNNCASAACLSPGTPNSTG